jgi:predicted membrane-bound spermidine synthase
LRRYFAFFFVSGFCSVLYELVWLRLAMAQFGVTTALVSIVLSSFMAGLGLGSWLAGDLMRSLDARIKFPVLRLYALIEALIGVSALLVPQQLEWGRAALERTNFSSSGSYYLASGLWVACTLVPWCACMGATIPVVMLAIRRNFPGESPRSFSYLYVANVLGAVVGAGLPLLLIEFFGFHDTLKFGAVCNFLLAASAMSMTLGKSGQQVKAAAVAHPNGPIISQPSGSSVFLVLLLLTGLTSMGMEVVWIRQFTPYLGTVVYAFALILAVYLAATLLGSRIYRRWSTQKSDEGTLIWIVLGVVALLPLLTANPDIHMGNNVRVILGIAPFTGLLGFLTPMLVDRWSGGDPGRAGTAYAINVVGCILGPLVAGFLLLPHMSERWVLLTLSLPWLVVGAYPNLAATGREAASTLRVQLASYMVVPLAVVLLLAGKGFEERFPQGEVLRDNTATIIATGTGRGRLLLVNGVGITGLTPITKMMAHLPLTFLDRPPKNALVVCFGMGTTYRSLMSWGIPVTAVELVPSVPRVFGYYHEDAESLLDSPRSHVVIDDGRRYLERTNQQYDVITIDPPPPVEAAGSSLLYSEEFYAVVKRRLRPDGVFQQWLPWGENVVVASVAKALRDSFRYVRVYRSVEGWGAHFLASDRPIPDHTPAELVSRMPAKAVEDLMEWGPAPNAEAQFATVLNTEIPIDSLIALAPQAPPMRDDRPMNEYYVLRRDLVPKSWQSYVWRER